MILVADSVSKSYQGQRVLASARLSAASGEITGLLGRMGSGKSTLLKICSGLVQPESGWVEFGGKRYMRPRRSVLARAGLFYLGESDNLAWTLTVGRHLDEIQRRFGSRIEEDVIEMLDLRGLLARKPDSLSGVEIKRVELGLAFARRPLVLLADEPLRSVDPKQCELSCRALKLLASRGCAVVVSGHEVNMLMPYLDSITWVTSGTTYALGSVEHARSDERFAREYLGVPGNARRAS
jgi:ABC-type multidrug transport system ATPase subunit